MNGTPTDLVLKMRYDGLTNNQIIQNLQRQGFQSNQIFDAMSQADLKLNQGSPAMHPQQSIVQSTPSFASDLSPDKQMIEETAEAIINERWQEFEDSVKKIITWKNATENKVQALSLEIESLKDNMNNLQKAIFSKVEDYDKNVTSVSSNVKALETAFTKLTPALSSSIHELSRLTSKMGKGK